MGGDYRRALIPEGRDHWEPLLKAITDIKQFQLLSFCLTLLWKQLCIPHPDKCWHRVTMSIQLPPASLAFPGLSQGLVHDLSNCSSPQGTSSNLSKWPFETPLSWDLGLEAALPSSPFPVRKRDGNGQKATLLPQENLIKPSLFYLLSFYPFLFSRWNRVLKSFRRCGNASWACFCKVCIWQSLLYSLWCLMSIILLLELKLRKEETPCNILYTFIVSLWWFRKLTVIL